MAPRASEGASLWAGSHSGPGPPEPPLSLSEGRTSESVCEHGGSRHPWPHCLCPPGACGPCWAGVGSAEQSRGPRLQEGLGPGSPGLLALQGVSGSSQPPFPVPPFHGWGSSETHRCVGMSWGVGCAAWTLAQPCAVSPCPWPAPWPSGLGGQLPGVTTGAQTSLALRGPWRLASSSLPAGGLDQVSGRRGRGSRDGEAGLDRESSEGV